MPVKRGARAAVDCANYRRKPRGGCANLPESYGCRLSFCCNRDGCRKRTTPPSVRFLGRKVYLGAVVILVAAMPHYGAAVGPGEQVNLERERINRRDPYSIRVENDRFQTVGYLPDEVARWLALLAYNVISVVKTAMAAVHGETAKREMISGYYLAGELAAAYHGMMIAVPPAEWARHFASLTPAQLAAILKTLAAKVRPDRFRKNIRGPKKPRPKRSNSIVWESP